MTKNKVILTLNGDIPLDLFADSIKRFSDLVSTLSKEVGGTTEIEWQVADLESGSATATIIGLSPEIEVVERVVGAYEVVIQALEKGSPIPYSANIVKAAKALTSILDGKIKSMQLATQDHASLILESSVNAPIFSSTTFGSITGMVETLSSRQTLRFILYDILFDKAVKCYVDESKREMIRDIWDKRVSVTGTIRRDPISGRPYEVRDIEHIQTIGEQRSGSFKRAKGVIPWKEGSKPSEQIIRRIRDEE